MSPSIEHAFEDRNARAHRSYVARADGCDPQALWQLLSRPRHWPLWAPHIRRAARQVPNDDQPLRVGDRMRIEGWTPRGVTATITRVQPPTRWDFRARLPLGHRVDVAHEVLGAPTAVRVQMVLRGPMSTTLGGALLAGCAPIAKSGLRRLARLARGRGGRPAA